MEPDLHTGKAARGLKKVLPAGFREQTFDLCHAELCSYQQA